jgi:hypothetical protein
MRGGHRRGRSRDSVVFERAGPTSPHVSALQVGKITSIGARTLIGGQFDALRVGPK